MGIGTAKAERRVRRGAQETFASAKQALKTIGTVTEVDESELFMRGVTKFGLQRVRLKVFVAPVDGGTAAKVTVKALADDIWGKGARKGCESFLEALEE